MQSSACASQNIAVEQDIATVADLEKTYPYRNLEDILRDNGGHLRIEESAGHFDVVVNIILAIEQSDQIIEIRQLSKRIYCYALAKLHPKGTSIDEIMQRAQYALGNVQNIKSKVYHYLRLGNRWGTIVNLFESIVRDLITQQSEIQLTGILCVLGTGSV